ncbi:aldehyde dehydrogenase family protein [Actinomadura sp. LD22]|uniref:Aldehyde dehydrogenase family protein n=1 Tax=Actinomadura physcomitrii TaxID=2650748 RepID=A0A6I4M9C7_9ACTN|nr:aldehyde dehydrogenase family protein [Actinomadura physcomitrii]MWA00834.1 aldehyde dehydrogenase family protein [Actinomadura physcomitrii]
MSDVDRMPPKVHLRINGEKLEKGSGGTYEHISPVTEQVDARIPLAGEEEVDLAVSKAHEAFQIWKRMSPAQRREPLRKLADLIEANSAEFARLGALDNGTPVTIGSAFPATSAEWTRYYAGWADKIQGDVTGNPVQDGELGYTLAQPYGVVGIIITWNGPLISLAMKIPPAVAAGNAVVVKPSELTPFSGELFMDLVEEAGFPPGVINVLPGTAEAGARLVAHPLVKKVSFTGGPATATKILETCAPDMKPAVLELGGKSANIVFEDADIEAACHLGTTFSLIALSGQGCAFATRMIVHEDVYDQVVDQVKLIAGNIPIGDPFDPGIMSGPVVNEAAAERIISMIERAKEQGATLVTGGARLDRVGYFIQPTVFTDVDPASELAQTEVFGPVLAIFKFSTEEEAIALANGTRYALSSYVQTRDLKRAIRVAAELEAGETLINGAVNLQVGRPFGGFGLSGAGKEGGRQGIEEFLRIRSVGIAI